jgi:hypothetical protein
MSQAYYLGNTPKEILNDAPRFWYAIRRNEDGELFLVRSDQLTDKSSYDINSLGSAEENFENFEFGIDYFDGIDEEHEIVDRNLNYPQYKWDNRSLYYYVNAEGHLVQRLFKGYTYPEGISS